MAGGAIACGKKIAHLAALSQTLTNLWSFKAARRSRACTYLADDDHGPMARLEILLPGCPAAGVRTGISFVRTGETGVVVARLPPGTACVECDRDAVALNSFIDAIEQAHSIDRHSVRAIASDKFDTTRIVDGLLESFRSPSEGVHHATLE